MPILPALPPAVEQVQPASPDQAYAQGVALRRAGRDAEAAALFAEVLRQRPADVDARLNLGLSLLALGRLDAAERELNTVVEQAPAYADAHIALARIAQRRGDRAEAERRLALAEAARPGDPAVAALRTQLAAPEEPRARIDLSAAESDLSQGLSPWRQVVVGAARRLDDRTTLSASADWTERFDRTDLYLEAGVAHRWSWGATTLSLGGTPDADYRPELSVRGGVERAVGAGWAVTLDGSLSRYPVGTVSSLQPGVQWSDASGRVQLGARWINTWDETDARQTGYALRGAFAVTPRLTLRAGYADAPETDQGITIPVVSHSLGLEFAATERVTVRLNVLDEDRGAFDRREIGLGLGWRY